MLNVVHTHTLIPSKRNLGKKHNPDHWCMLFLRCCIICFRSILGPQTWVSFKVEDGSKWVTVLRWPEKTIGSHLSSLAYEPLPDSTRWGNSLSWNQSSKQISLWRASAYKLTCSSVLVSNLVLPLTRAPHCSILPVLAVALPPRAS